MIRAITQGLRRASTRLPLVFFLLLVNLGFAALLAFPMASRLRSDLRNRDAARGMLYGFDTAWWEQWRSSRSGFFSSLSPDILGAGFAFKNAEFALKGELPLRLFASPAGEDPERLDPAILVLAFGYLVVQAFLSGGVLKVLRSGSGAFHLRAFLHSSGFYFSRVVGIGLVALAFFAVVFLLERPLARLVSAGAQDLSSEAGALALSLAGQGALLLALFAVQTISSLAKVFLMVEDRSSALLAFVSSLGFCLRHPFRTAGVVVAFLGLGAGLLAIFLLADGAMEVTGYRSQIAAFGLFQAFLFGCIFLRVCLFSGLMALLEDSAGA